MSSTPADGVELSDLKARLAAIEVRAEEDRQRLVQALHELSRQRDQLPAAQDWRSQMQALVTQLDGMGRQLAEVAASAATRREGVKVAEPDVHAADLRLVRHDGEAERARLAAERAREQRITELAGLLQRQTRDLERLGQSVARLEKALANTQTASRVAPAGGDREHAGPQADQSQGDARARNHRRVDPGWGAGAMATAVAASAAAMLVRGARTQAQAEPQVEPQANYARVPASSRSGEAQPDVIGAQALTQDGAGRGRARRRRSSRTAHARARQRTARRFGRLTFAHVARLGLRGWPKRRERSWWHWLNDRERWRQARQLGGRFRTFGERFNHRARPSGRSEERAPRRRDGNAQTASQEKRFYLSMDDDNVDAPSIGPKTAERLRPARIFTVRDLLSGDAEEIAAQVTARHITAQAVRDWQDQARLVITVPFLRGTHAQLLVGAGFRNYEQIALAEQATLMSGLLRFATTREGQSILRNGPPPDLEKVVKWMEHALESEPARAA